MTLCPIAVVAGCQKCPAFKICPLKGILGDKPKTAVLAPEPPARPSPKAKAGATARPRSATPRKKARPKTAV